MENAALRAAYGLDPELQFDRQFSPVSIEASIIGVVAYVWYLIVRVIAAFRTETDRRIELSYMASIPWYYDRCLAYQHGHDLVFDPQTYRFGYARQDPDAQIVKFAAVRQVQDVAKNITVLKVFTNKAGNVPLTGAEHEAFKEYMRRVGAAGIHYEFVNLPPDELKIALQVIFNPLVLDSTGAKILDNTYPVREAVQAYIAGITFGGMLNRNHLIDAIQAAEGVVDVILNEIEHSTDGDSFTEATGPDIVSESGSFIINTINDTYTPGI